MNIALILIAGKGERFKSETPKQFVKLNGKDVFLYCFETFLSIKELDKIVLVTSNEYKKYVEELIKNYKSDKDIEVVEGGKTRQQSVFFALSKLKDEGIKDDDFIIIHDGVRPLVSKEIILNHIKNNHEEALVTAIKVNDSVANFVDKKIDNYASRDLLYLIQTPQSFKFKTIYEAHIYANKEKISVNDDSSLLVNLKKVVKLLDGSNFNIKITNLDDIKIIEALIKK